MMAHLIKLLVVGSGGFFGAVLRYSVSGWVHRFFGGVFPLGILVVNVVGCLVIGFLMGLLEQRQVLGPHARLFWMIGLLGAFTTFSTFGYDTFELLREKSFLLGGINIVANVVLGLLAAWCGWVLVKLISS
jgi:CrcB protein